jgi:N6-adenosine-specific RNA methylase IME4
MEVGDADVRNKGADKVLMIHGQPQSVVTLSQQQLEEWKEECLERFPLDRTYQIIYADPPWSYGQMGRVEGLTPYPTMSMEELKKLPVPQISDATSVLFLWVTNPLLDKGLDLLRAWGFEYKTVYKVWCKRSTKGHAVSGCGWWSRPSTEMVLVGARGSGYMQWKKTYSEPQEFMGVRRKHSEKPDEIRDSIRGFFDAPGGLRRIELFARSKADGFDAWGLEVPGFFDGEASAAGAAAAPAAEDAGDDELKKRVKALVYQALEPLLTRLES